MDVDLAPSRSKAVAGSCGRRDATRRRGEVCPSLGVGVVDVHVTQDSCTTHAEGQVTQLFKTDGNLYWLQAEVS
jgi:hypothetical protein